MMNGHEKSDSVIVAEKPANKAAHFAVEQSAVELAVAEPVERRAETKGNASQQSTCRTQSRISVSLLLAWLQERLHFAFACDPFDLSNLRSLVPVVPSVKCGAKRRYGDNDKRQRTNRRCGFD